MATTTSDDVEQIENGAPDSQLDDSQLVERLMQWGTALREYQQQAMPNSTLEGHLSKLPEVQPEDFTKAEQPEMQQENAKHRGIECREIERPDIDLQNLELSEKELLEIELLNSMSQSVKLVNKSILGSTPMIDTRTNDTKANDANTNDARRSETTANEIEVHEPGEIANSEIANNENDSYEIDSFVDAPLRPGSRTSSPPQLEDLSSLYASSAFQDFDKETRLDTLTEESANATTEMNKIKILPPKYSSIPEMRLMRLAQMDLGRRGQTGN